jgi:Flp pilus assembly protein TadD
MVQRYNVVQAFTHELSAIVHIHLMPVGPPPNPAATAERAEEARELAWIDPYDRRHRRAWAAVGLLLLITAAACLPALSADFLWQDDVAVTRNDALRSLHTIGYMWLHPRSRPMWRPVAETALLPQHLLWSGWNAGGYHAVSLALHLLNTLLVWLVLRRLGVAGALAVAGLFALHPIAVQPTAWIAQQPVLLATMFLLLTTLAWLRLTQLEPPPPEFDESPHFFRRPTVVFVLMAASLLAALLSDVTIACGVSLVLLLLVKWKRGRIDAPIWRLALPLLAMSGVITALIVWWARAQSDVVVPILHWPAVGAQALAFHVQKLLFPWPLLLTYETWRVTAASVLPIIITGILAVAMMLSAPRRRTPIVIATAAFIALLLPAVLFAPSVEGGYLADHQQYLARLALLALIVPLLVQRVPEPDADGRHRATRPAIAAALALGLSVLVWKQTKLYANSDTAWNHVLKHEPDSRIARSELGRLLMTRGSAAEAEVQFARLVELAPDDASAHLVLGEVQASQGNFAAATRHYQRAAELRPMDGSVWRHLGAAAAQSNDIAGAVSNYQKALKIDPQDDIARNNLASVYARSGEIDRAFAELQRALVENPQSTAAHLNLANLLFTTGKLDAAAEHLQQAVKIDPNNFNAYMTAGTMLMNFKDFHNAERMFRQAIRIQRDTPAAATAFNALGVALEAQGQHGEAVYNFGRAADLDPKLAAAQKNLATAQQRRGGVPSVTQQQGATTAPAIAPRP